MAVYGSFLTKLGVSAEVTPGTAPGTTPVLWIPSEAPKIQDSIPYYEDKSYRGIAAESFGHYALQSTGTSIEVGGPFIPDSSAVFAWGAYGQDTTTAAPSATTTTGTNALGATSLTITSGTGFVNGAAILIDTGAGLQESNVIVSGGGTTTLTLAAPLRFTHNAGAAVAGNTLHAFQLASTPKTFTVWDFYGVNWHQFTYGTVEEFSLKWAAGAEASYTAKLKSFLSTVPTTPGASSFSSIPPFMGWQSGVALNGTSQTNLEELELTFARKVVPVPGPNSQNPAAIFAATLGVTGKATFQMSTNNEYNLYRNGTVEKWQFFLYGPAPGAQGTPGATGLAFTATLPTATMAEIGRDKEYVRVQLDFAADYSTSDAGPGQLQVTNAATGAMA